MLAILLSASTVSYIAAGQFMVLLGGQFDMSVGNVAAMGGVIYTMLVVAGVSVPFAMLLALGFGALSGFIAGVCVSRFNTNAFITTFAQLQIYRGILFVLTGGSTISVKPNDAFRFIGTYKVFGVIQMPIVIMVVIFISFWFILKYTKLGRSIYCVGNNAEAAKISGINVPKTITFSFMMTGFFAALSGVVFASRVNSGQPNLGTTYALDTIAAAVIGGTVMSGGKGNIWGAFIGIMVVYVIQNGLIMSGLDSYYHYIFTGLIMFFAVLAQREKTKK
jgi:ribose transport system permease protein